MDVSSITHSDQPSSAKNVAACYGWSIVVARWLSAWIDFLVLACFLLLPDYLFGNDVYRRTMAVWLGLLVFYFPVTEAAFGKSLGKLVTRIRVVNASGRKPSFRQAVVRTILRWIEVNPFFLGGVPAGIAVLVSPCRQRLGDRAARTFVLWDNDALKILAKELPDASLKRP